MWGDGIVHVSFSLIDTSVLSALTTDNINDIKLLGGEREELEINKVGKYSGKWLIVITSVYSMCTHSPLFLNK